ncbi:MAG: hypothetical protein JW741_17690, partial [Sedimentisphaerales bacterium]|nr:hypothetical protein [Sedimentisphaerales bacterium]
PVSGDGNDVGGLIGLDDYDRGSFLLCYWDIETSGMATSNGGFGRLTRLMMAVDTFCGWAQANAWTILDGADYPRLAWEQQQGQPIAKTPAPYGGGTGDPNDPYLIYNAEQFGEIAHRPGDFRKAFALMADIDMACIDTNEMLPIGTPEVPFLGWFLGNGHTISNFRCLCPGSSYVGVFGALGWPGYAFQKPAGAAGIVTDLNLVNAYVFGAAHIGSLAGVSAGRITNVSVTANVEGTGSVGGLVGHNLGTIDTSSSSISVSGTSSVGGLVGTNGQGMTATTIAGSHSDGTVNGNQSVGGLIGHSRNPVADCASDCNVTGTTAVGGLIGDNVGALRACHSTGNIEGHATVGGLAGSNGAGLDQCHATGDVTADGDNVGGLTGLNTGYSSEILSCYATGDIRGRDRTGGLVGSMSGSIIRECYSRSHVRGNDAVGGLVGKAFTKVESCYAGGTVEGNDFVGGLIGVSCDPVVACYSTGRVLGNSYTGGFVGRSWYKEVESCFWDIFASERTVGNGYYPNQLDGLVGLPTAQMQTAQTFLDGGWDFMGETANGTDDIWWIDEGQDYPRLWWEAAPE